MVEFGHFNDKRDKKKGVIDKCNLFEECERDLYFCIMEIKSIVAKESWANFIAIFLVLIFMIIQYLSSENIFEHTWLQAFFYIMPTIVLVIFHNLVMIPYLFDRQKYGLYAFSILILILLTQAITGYFTYAHYFNYQIGILILDFGRYFITTSAVFGFIGLQRLAAQTNRNYEQQLLIRQSELKSLKSQINPHFLFNNLNNIYFLCLERSEKAADVVEKLSSLLRYSLEQTDKEYVALEKEFQFINNYINLEKSRLPDSGKINLERTGDFANLKIAPLILITFVENCFKHGANRNSKDPYVDIQLEVKDGVLNFFCDNNVSGSNLERDKLGTGLNNVKKRLQLIYPKRHQLQINTSENRYTVKLSIQL